MRSDQIVMFKDRRTRAKYPQPLRRVSFLDTEQRRRLVFMTNDLVLPTLSVVQLYRCRWQIELLFKWIKQHLRIKHFFGTSANAVKTQLWVAISVYVLVAIIRKELQIDRSRAEILQILSITLLEQTPLFTVLANESPLPEPSPDLNQLMLFDF